MIPVFSVKGKYYLGLEEYENQFFMLFYTIYKERKESVCVRLPYYMFSEFVNKGSEDFYRTVLRIEEDYQVGRFSKHNPRLMMDYILAIPEEKITLEKSFEERISLVDQEVIRLLYLFDRDLAKSTINKFIAQGKLVSIEIFCLAFSFYNQSNPLHSKEGDVLIRNTNSQTVLETLKSSLVWGSTDAGAILLSALNTFFERNDLIYFFKRLDNICNEFNFRYVRNSLGPYIQKVSLLSETDYTNNELTNILSEFRKEFEKEIEFEIGTNSLINNWISPQQTIAWKNEYISCLVDCFMTFRINIGYKHAANMLSFLNGSDDFWNTYSIGQFIKHMAVDHPRNWTKENINMPKFPAKGNEDLIIGIWKHYFYYFLDSKQVNNEFLKSVLNEFTTRWNNK